MVQRLAENERAIRTIKAAHPDVKILALTFHKEDSYIHAALEAGADGYVLKDDSRNELVIAIGSVLHGKNYLSPAICGQVRKRKKPATAAMAVPMSALDTSP